MFRILGICNCYGLHIIKTPRLLEMSEYSSELYLDSHYSPQSLQDPSILQDFRVSQRKVHFPIELDYHPKYKVETEKPGCSGVTPHRN